jgi:branched-subunit amino acid transport protein
MNNRLIIIIAMALATYLTKGTLMFLGGKRELPNRVRQWLGYMPLAIIASLIAPSFFIREGQFVKTLINPYLWAGLIAAAVAYWRENLLLTMVVGVAALLVFRTLIY